MGQPGDIDVDMESLPVDDFTLDRLLSGTLDPDDAPPGYAGVARLLQAAAGPAALGARHGSEAASMAFGVVPAMQLLGQL